VEQQQKKSCVLSQLVTFYLASHIVWIELLLKRAVSAIPGGFKQQTQYQPLLRDEDNAQSRSTGVEETQRPDFATPRLPNFGVLLSSADAEQDESLAGIFLSGFADAGPPHTQLKA
jgi:hypothetical protein